MPPTERRNIMTDVEKLILERLDQLDGKLEKLDYLEEKLEKLDHLEEKLEKLDHLEENFAKLDHLEENLAKLDHKVTKIQLTVENDINKKIDIIGEGHDFLKQRLNEALQMERKREHMELELINLKMEVKKIKEHLNIA